MHFLAFLKDKMAFMGFGMAFKCPYIEYTDTKKSATRSSSFFGLSSVEPATDDNWRKSYMRQGEALHTGQIDDRLSDPI